MSDCVYCNSRVDPDDASVFHGVTGWERKAHDPNRRGGSDITMRRRTGAVACGQCVERLRLGLSVAQESLL